MPICIKDKMKIFFTELSDWGNGGIKKNLLKYIKNKFKNFFHIFYHNIPLYIRDEQWLFVTFFIYKNILPYSTVFCKKNGGLNFIVQGIFLYIMILYFKTKINNF